MRNEEDIWEDQAFQNGQSFSKRFRQRQKTITTDKFSPNLKEIVGECYKCHHYNYVINDVHQLIYSSCGMFNTKLGKHSVKECSGFIKRQEMSLTYMFSIATYIDVGKRNAGFLTKKNNN